VNGGTRFDRLWSDIVENIFHSISVSLDCFGRKHIFLPFLAVNTLSHSLGYSIFMP
jgi:hypothetical protein